MKQTRFNAARFKELRLAKGWKQQELATRSGVAQQQISDYESGRKKNPSVEVVAKLAAALETTVEYLVDAIDYAGPLTEREVAMLRDLHSRGENPDNDDFLDVWLDHLPKQE